MQSPLAFHTAPRAKQLRVLFVSASLTGGGAERIVSTLLCHLDRERYLPSLSLMRNDVSYPLPEDVPVTGLHKHKPWHIPQAIWRLRKVIQRTRPEVIVSNMTYTNWVTGVALAGLSPRPRWIARFASDPYSEYGRYVNVVLRPLLGRLLQSAEAAWVANSTLLADRVKRYFHLSDQAIVSIIFNPLDLARIDAAAREPLDIPVVCDCPIILAVGRLARAKRPDVLLEAFAQVRREISAVLWICGDGPLRKQLLERIATLGLQDDVRLWGFQSNPYAFMRRAALLAITSDYEGMPNALLEAQALGLPVVSTNCPTGPAELIEDGVTGYLVPPGDVQAVAEAVLGLLSHPERSAAMGRRARQRVRALFPVQKIVSEWECLLDHIAEGTL